LISSGCKSGRAVKDSGESVDQEAQKEAQKVADLVISKCGSDYVWGYGLSTEQHLKKFDVKAIKDWGEESNHYSEDYLLGYEWRGKVTVTTPNQNVSGYSFSIYKRNGSWFYRPQDRNLDDDVRIEDLQPTRPDCKE
jgi:hypothetical protein